MKQLGLLLSESSVNHNLFLLATVPLHILSACDDLYRHVVGFVAGMHGCYVPLWEVVVPIGC